MEYNNYYPVQSGHPLPNQQHLGGSQMQQPPPQPGGQMMHPQMPQQNIRQTIPPGPPNHQQQMQQMQSQQQQQHIGHHPQQLNPQQQQQQQHPSYQQIQPPHPHGPPVSHSSSPHAQQQHHHQPQQHQHHNHNHSHQPSMPGTLPQPQGMSQHVHSHSPHHHGGAMHMQQQQPLNQMVRPQVGPAVMNHPQPGLQQSIHHQQNFFSGGSIPQQSNIHHYSPNPHHSNHQAQHHQPPVMHHVPPMSAQHPHMQQSIGRNSSPYYPNILQTEFRIIELNRRLQCRPTPRHPYNPLPGTYDESIWWERFASDFFEDDATLTLRMHDDKPVEYTIGRTLIPRFFRSYFTGGVTDLSFNLRNPKETCIHPHMITLDCDQAFIVTNNIFRHPSIAAHQGVVVHTEGHLVLDFVSNSYDNLTIKSWRFYTRGCREYIDRSILSTMGLPTTYLAEPITKHGFTKSTITYLKMCMIMEPMQELMFQNKQTKLDPRSCLRKLLFDRYKFRSGEDNRAATSKRRKRKPSAAPAVTGNATTNKKSKAGINNAIGNNAGMNNMMMSPSSVAPNFSLASQDVMVVGEPSMMGGDFGDDNERMITRLENTQYDPNASNQSMVDESDSTNALTSADITRTSEEMEASLENHSLAPAMMHLQQALSPLSEQQQQQQQQQQQHQPQQLHQQLQQQPQLQQPHQPLDHQQPPSQSQGIQHHDPPQSAPERVGESQGISPQNQTDFSTIQAQVNDDHNIKVEPQDSMQATADLGTGSGRQQLDDKNQMTMFEQQHDDESRRLGEGKDQTNDHTQSISQNGDIEQARIETHQTIKEEVSQSLGDVLADKEDAGHQIAEETTMNSISDISIDASIVNNVGSVEPSENHSNSIQIMHEEPDSNSQLQCSTPSTKSTMEQQQPVDNGVA